MRRGLSLFIPLDAMRIMQVVIAIDSPSPSVIEGLFAYEQGNHIRISIP